MVSDSQNVKPEQNLLPDRYPQAELFLCDVADAFLKDDMASMEYPVFSLAKKPDMETRRYENGPKWLDVSPSSKGIATIYDKDLLIYCISQMIAKMNEGGAICREVQINARELLQFTNRTTGGKDYDALCDAVDRLRGTNIKTNITTGGVEQFDVFGLIDKATIRRSEKSNRILEMRITLSDWVFNAIKAKEVLTLHPHYFRLKKGIERRVYEIARKHCGKQPGWKIGLEALQAKCGSRDVVKGFRRAIKELASGDHLPDYAVRFDEPTDMIEFENRAVAEERRVGIQHPKLDPEAIHDGRQIAEGWDIYGLEQDFWEKWHRDGRQRLFDPTKAFLGFVRKVVESRGPAR